ncbi:MAG: hypothetical protein ACAI25_17760 [Planctomycetota bacterium]
MLRTQLVIAFLLGAVVALSAALVVGAGRLGLPEAYAQTAGNNEVVAIMGTMNTGKGPTDNLYLVDSKTMRLAIYKWNGQYLELGAVRNMTYDLKFEEYPGKNQPQKPSVEEMRDLTRNEDGKAGPKKK